MVFDEKHGLHRRNLHLAEPLDPGAYRRRDDAAFEVLVSKVHPKSVVNYGLEKVRFMAPVRSGKRVRNRIKLAGVDDRGSGRYLVTTENTIEIEGEIKPALKANAIAIFIE